MVVLASLVYVLWPGGSSHTDREASASLLLGSGVLPVLCLGMLLWFGR